MTTHTLTDGQRRLLEDCPRKELRAAIKEQRDCMIDIAQWENSWTVDPYGACKRGAYIPRAAVEAWLAEQDEREAEIDRRIGEAIAIMPERLNFDDWESATDVFFVSAAGLLYRDRRAAPSTAIPVPRERIRAALDAKRAAEKKAAYGPPPPGVRQAWREAQEDHFRDAAEMVEGTGHRGDAMTERMSYSFIQDLKDFSGLWQGARSLVIAELDRARVEEERLAKRVAELESELAIKTGDSDAATK